MVFLYGLSFSAKAQQILFPTHHPLSFGFRVVEPTQASIMLAQANSFQKQPIAFSSGSIKDMPFFCALECKVRNHTNIWIKLRAGDDASYMRMITINSK